LDSSSVKSGKPVKPVKLLGRYRHQGSLEKLTITEIGNKVAVKGYYLINFDKPQKAIASGQSLVLYDGKVCLGGGIIV
jgi:tRNA-specific 2-thiouridylase